MTPAVLAIAALAGSDVVSIRAYSGGDISGASRVELGDGRVVVAKSGPVVSAEAAMLRQMRETGAPVPQVLGCDGEVLLIEEIPASGGLSGEAWGHLASALSQLHSGRGESYGWDEDYALRHVRVPNDRCDDWARFWAENRLLTHVPHLPASIASRVERLASRLSELLPADPPAALVHGDMWGGNVLVRGKSIAALFDPCAFYGDREVDAATLTAFDNPPQRFFEEMDLAQDWRGRQPVYRLWIWLVHVRLFGASYTTNVQNDLETLGF